MSMSTTIEDGDARTVSLSEAAVIAVADERGIDPTDLPPLYEFVDPDALDALFEGRCEMGGEVRFTLDGCVVTVYADGRVEADLPAE